MSDEKSSYSGAKIISHANEKDHPQGSIIHACCYELIRDHAIRADRERLIEELCRDIFGSPRLESEVTKYEDIPVRQAIALIRSTPLEQGDK